MNEIWKFFSCKLYDSAIFELFFNVIGGREKEEEVGATVSLLHPFDLIVVIKLPNSTLCIGIAEHGVCEN